jgi:hypothetical protein
MNKITLEKQQLYLCMNIWKNKIAGDWKKKPCSICRILIGWITITNSELKCKEKLVLHAFFACATVKKISAKRWGFLN